MSYKEKGEFIWTSFSDLMISLFCIMLFLYVISFLEMRNREIRIEEQRRATEKQVQEIKDIATAVQHLDKRYFQYNEQYKRYSLTQRINFEMQSSIVESQYIPYLLAMGKSLQDSILALQQRFYNKKISYLVVIEGMASKDSYKNNDQLSYSRALAIYKLWVQNGIMNHFTPPELCEIQISGSGIRGIGRNTTDEWLNQQILIQVIPKINFNDLLSAPTNNN